MRTLNTVKMYKKNALKEIAKVLHFTLSSFETVYNQPTTFQKTHMAHYAPETYCKTHMLVLYSLCFLRQ